MSGAAWLPYHLQAPGVMRWGLCNYDRIGFCRRGVGSCCGGGVVGFRTSTQPTINRRSGLVGWVSRRRNPTMCNPTKRTPTGNAKSYITSRTLSFSQVMAAPTSTSARDAPSRSSTLLRMLSTNGARAASSKSVTPSTRGSTTLPNR